MAEPVDLPAKIRSISRIRIVLKRQLLRIGGRIRGLVLELVDRQVLGTCGSNAVEVRSLSSPPKNPRTYEKIPSETNRFY